MRTSPYRLNISETCILDNTPFFPLSVGVYWPSTTALKTKLSWRIAFTNAFNPSSKFCSVSLLFPVKVRVSVIQVKVCLPGPDRDCWLRRAHSLLEADFPGAWHCWCVCPQLMCLVLSCFAETSPPGSLCPLQRCAVVSQLEDHGMLVVFPEVAICGSTHS